MSVRKRLWTTRLGERKEAWIVDYVDGQGDRHIKTFTRKKDADAEAAKVKVDVGLGIHTAPSKSITVAAAAEDWIRFVTLEKREAATIAGYRQHVERGELQVRQRADRFNTIGRPKSASGERVVPIGPMVANTLRQWKLKCPKSERDLVFPTGTGSVENHSNIVQRMLAPAQVAA